MNEVTINGITHPSTTGFNFESTFPCRMVSIYLITNRRDTILAVKYWAFDFLIFSLPTLNLKSDCYKVGTQNRKNPITRQSFFQC